MTVVRRRWPRQDVEIPIRALLLDYTNSEFYRNSAELRREVPGRLAQTLLDDMSDYVAEYQDPLTGIWMSCGGWEAPSFGTPDLSQAEVQSLFPQERDDNRPTHGEAVGWIAFARAAQDVLEAMVLAGWVPTRRGLNLALAARRLVDERHGDATASDSPDGNEKPPIQYPPDLDPSELELLPDQHHDITPGSIDYGEPLRDVVDPDFCWGRGWLEAAVRAGWVPHQEGIELAQEAQFLFVRARVKECIADEVVGDALGWLDFAAVYRTFAARLVEEAEQLEAWTARPLSDIGQGEPNPSASPRGPRVPATASAATPEDEHAQVRLHVRADTPAPDVDAIVICNGCAWRWPCPSVIAGRELAPGEEGKVLHDLLCQRLASDELQGHYKELDDGTTVDSGRRDGDAIGFTMLPLSDSA